MWNGLHGAKGLKMTKANNVYMGQLLLSFSALLLQEFTPQDGSCGVQMALYASQQAENPLTR